MKTTALLIIDLQNDYFEGGAFELDPPQRTQALESAALLLEAARQSGAPIIHVQHLNAHPEAPFFRQGTLGAELHPRLAPQPGEEIIIKAHANSFLDTRLQEVLLARGIERLVVGGAMAWMCIQGTVRAASERGYEVLLVSDMVASRGYAWQGRELDAETTKAAALAPLCWRFAKATSVTEAQAALA